ncbi:unnamed protein product [Schistosoma intercalatum]|nr:unnamed protein product [Schistosoma intercalatum]CAH8625230.1 unnamed protein product [Schistosoma intercalatum]
MFEFKFYENSDDKEFKRHDTVTYSNLVQSFTLSDGYRDVLNLRTDFHAIANGSKLWYIAESVLDDYLRKLPKSELNVFDAVHAREDVKPGFIEGGFTLWDGSKDLVDYISKYLSERMCEKNVLELGCGCGLPGIFAIKAGARLVRFQDYNSEVLKCWTIPNIIINSGSQNDADSHNEHTQLEFYSGDWFHLSKLWQSSANVKFDYIFTSETIYRTDLYERLHNILETSLCQSGIVLLACKASYGPGGNIFDWLTYVENLGVFQTTTFKLTTSGVMRYIVKMIRA